MAITYERVIQQALSELGAVLGATATAAETNYDASPTTSTVIGPDFTPGMVEDALAGVIGQTVEAIASTPHHPERQRFGDVTANLANKAAIPQVGASAARIIGIPGFVRDSSDGEACIPATLDEVRSYNRFPSIYAGADSYRYAYNGNRIEHTRSSVVLEVCVYTRPSAFTGAIALDDWHEPGLVAGIVEILSTKESMFAELNLSASKRRAAHLAEIRSYGDPNLYGKAQAAPSSI